MSDPMGYIFDGPWGEEISCTPCEGV
jgi:hypothetical protein